MKKIFLWENKDYKSFDYENIADLSNEFDKANIKIGFNAIIGNNAYIGFNAMIGDKAHIGDDARIGFNAHIGDDARISNNARILKTLFITGSKHSVCWYSTNVINIGCYKYRIAYWQANFERIGKDNSYTDAQIAEYKGYIDLCAALQKTV